MWGIGNGGTGSDAGFPAGAPIIGAGPTAPLVGGAVCSVAGDPILSGGTGPTTCGNVCAANAVQIGTGTGANACTAPAPTSGQVLEYTAPVGTPASFADLNLWLNPGHVTLSGSNVTTWLDQSGHGNNVTNSGSYPVYSAGFGPGGTNTLNFFGSKWLQSTNNLEPSGHDRTLWAVAHVSGSVTPLFAYRSGSPYAALYAESSGPGYVYSDGSTNLTASPLASTAFHLLKWSYRVGSPVVFAIDGVQATVSGGVESSDTGAAGFQVGTVAGQFWQDQISEVIEIGHVSTASDDALIGAYVNTTYGLTISNTTAWTPTTPPG